jgi:glycosyltransferase involved in cell wall biosynthesis
LRQHSTSRFDPVGVSAPRLGYLSGGPRVSTHPATEARGPRTHVLGVIGGFRAAGWQVQTFIVGDRMPGVVRDSESRIVHARPAAVAADVGRLVLRQVNGARAWQEMKGRVDWVYERLASFQALGRRFHRAGVPWLLETNAILYEEAVTERKSVVLRQCARKLELEAYRECDAIVCVSRELGDAVCREARVGPDKIIVLPNGVDTNLFDPGRWPPHHVRNFTVVFAGSLVAWQGLEALLRAIAELRDNHGVHVDVVIAGAGPMRGPLETLADALRVMDRVRFLGDVAPDKVPGVIAAGDIGYSGHLDLQGRRVFRSPLKLYEYLAMAKPVLASEMSDTRSLVRDEHGFLFEPGNSEDLQRALLAAIRQRERLPAMGRAGREEIVARHSWNARICELLGAVHQILGTQAA